MIEMKSVAKTKQWLTLAIALLLALAGGSWLAWKNWAGYPIEATKLPQTHSLLPTSPVSRPAPPPEGYVGSAACAECHEDLCKSFAQHPMGRSSALTPGPADIEDFSEAKAAFTAVDGTRYKAEKVGDEIWHHAIGTDSQGRTLYDQALRVSLAIGSGTRGKTYGVNRDGFLLQSPVTWYSTKGGYFELAPGYEKIAGKSHFSRRISEECLMCHIGRMEFDKNIPDKLIPPYFHEITIGCERCHGPGDKHVSGQQKLKAPSPDLTIVNPARLPMRERESICNQCHLHGDFRAVRYGRHPRDYRPGMALEDIFCILVKEETGSGNSKAVSQVMQMRDSKCFKSNPEKLGCTSCHDPHTWPEANRREEYYRSRCNECHTEHGCSLSVDLRAAKGDSCMACHMPRSAPKDIVHATQTDHRVLKKPISGEQPKTANVTAQALRVYDDGEKRIPYWEVQRTKGLMLFAENVSSDSPEILAMLTPLAAVAPDDVPLLHAIGTCHLNRQNNAEAIKWLEKAIAVEPKNEYVLTSLALAYAGARDYASAKRHIATAVEINPFAAANFAIQAHILAAAGEHELAFRAAEKVAELDPTQAALRDELLRTQRN